LVWIIPLRIDSLVDVLDTFIEVLAEKCKEFINEVKVLLRGYFTRDEGQEDGLSQRSLRSQNHFAFGE
jgi:hypothetical protein